MKLLTLLLILLISNCFSRDLRDHVKVDSLYIEMDKHIKSNRSFYLPEDESPGESFNLGFDLDISKNLYLDSKVSSSTNGHQFRFISLDSEIGFSKYNVDLYIKHFSGHTLDASLGRRFPESNAIGIRLNLIGKGRR